MATKTKPRPTSLFVGGVPYTINGKENPDGTCEDVSISFLADQEISIMDDLTFPRWLSYLSGEVAVRLLEAAGYSVKNVRKAAEPFGTVLYRFIRENKFDWIYTDAVKEPPTTIFINGMPYTVLSSEDKYLDARQLLGEVDYITLSIRIHSKLKAEARAVVFLHEAAHAMLYEARCMNICNKESLVEPLSYLLYQLFKQNDFSFAYNG